MLGFPQYILCKRFESVFVGDYILANKLYGIQTVRSVAGYALAIDDVVITEWYDFAIPLSAHFGYAGRFCVENFIFIYYLYDFESRKSVSLNGAPIQIFENRFLLLQYRNTIFSLIDLKGKICFDDIVIDKYTQVTIFSDIVFVYHISGAVIKEYFFEEFRLPIFYMLRPASTDFLIVNRGKGWFLIDKHGNELLSMSDCITYSNGVFRVKRENTIAYFIFNAMSHSYT